MFAVVAVGVLLLLTVIIVCLTARAIKAECFEFSAGISKVVTFSIKIISPSGTPTTAADIEQYKTQPPKSAPSGFQRARRALHDHMLQLRKQATARRKSTS